MGNRGDIFVLDPRKIDPGSTGNIECHEKPSRRSQDIIYALLFTKYELPTPSELRMIILPVGPMRKSKK